MNIGNITSDNFNLDGNGKDIQIEVYEQLIEQLQQENQELKRKLNETIHKATEFESEVYELKKQLEDLQETHYLIQGGRSNGKTYLMKLQADKEQLNSLVNSCQEKIRQLKKQVEEYKEQVNKGLYNTCLPYTTGYNKAIKDKENQQKEFIEWIENEIDICDGFLDTVKSDLQEIPYGVISANKTYITTQIKENETAHKVYKEILQKYKEIIGVSNENNMGNTK